MPFCSRSIRIRSEQAEKCVKTVRYWMIEFGFFMVANILEAKVIDDRRSIQGAVMISDIDFSIGPGSQINHKYLAAWIFGKLNEPYGNCLRKVAKISFVERAAITTSTRTVPYRNRRFVPRRGEKSIIAAR